MLDYILIVLVFINSFFSLHSLYKSNKVLREIKKDYDLRKDEYERRKAYLDERQSY